MIRRSEMLSIAKAVVILLLSTSLVASTDHYSPTPEGISPGTGAVLNVPYYGQGDTSWCLYYCLSMMSEYNNRHLEPWMLAMGMGSGNNETFKGQYDPRDQTLELKFKEASSLTMKRRIWGNNLNFGEGERFNAAVKNSIDRGQPILMAFQYRTGSTKSGHAVIAVGYDNGSIYITDPSGAITEDIFGMKGQHIAVPIPWEVFDQELSGNIKFSNMAFTIEIMEDAPKVTPGGSLYMTDRSMSAYSSLSFTNRSNATDIGLLRFDGKRNGYYIAQSSYPEKERIPTTGDTMSVYFTVSNPFPEEREYTVMSEMIRKDTGESVGKFRFPIDMSVPGYSKVSKGLNYSNQLASTPAGTYTVLLTLLDSDVNAICTTSVDVDIV